MSRSASRSSERRSSPPSILMVTSWLSVFGSVIAIPFVSVIKMAA